MMKRLFFLCVLAALQVRVSAQQRLEWKVNTFGFADNREYNNSNGYSQSILGIRLSPEIGLQIDSVHHLRVGASFLHEFGSSKGLDKVNPVIYYNFKDKGFDFYIGMFPRYDLLKDVPRAILNDTLMYYRPNIEGLLLRYANQHVMQQLWIDWTSRQTETAREQFLVGLSGKFNAGVLYLSDYATLFHDAGAMIPDSTRPLRDNAAVNVNIGANLSHHTFLDSLDLNAGLLMSFDRHRNHPGWNVPKGVLAHLYMEYRRFSIFDTFYAGEKQDIANGDRLYNTKSYNRLEFGWAALRFKNLEGKFIASFHFTNGAMDNQEQFMLRYNIGQSYSLKKRVSLD
ncbi:hypothetical protein SAMN05216436_11071 [bacterium A37T11]|nr:hypothetical protein SAMN05216436_11071 [bacterium A37T11]